MDPESASSTWDSRLKFYKTTFCLAYQSFGVVYGDLSTSPIYVFKSTFSGRLKFHEEEEEIFGVFSLVFWTLTLIPLCKYIIFVLGADDNGEGGTFALYSLLCRHARIGLLSTSNALDDSISDQSPSPSTKETKTSSFVKEFLLRNRASRIVLLLVVLLGTSMVIGDGVLTPSMSVLSAVQGIKVKIPSLHENIIVFVACMVLVGLFALQHYGTHRVGFLFAPILIAWLLCIGGVGIYNTIRWNPSVVNALSPSYVYNFFKKSGKDGWRSLGGIVLCITGAEAMFADLGHFSHLPVRLAFTAVVYPCLILAYMGEAAYLSKHKEDLQQSFYKSIPAVIFWPVFVIATFATIVGSQAIISATFSIISQCRALRCFPRVKIIHTSNHIHGQIYIPEVNWILMILCLAVVIGFRDTDMIGNAYGLAVIMVMFVTTCLMFLIIVMVWKRTIFIALSFVIGFGSLELLYLSACVAKVHKGGWLPLAISLIVMSMMCIWHYGTLKKQSFELQNKVSLNTLLSLGQNLVVDRLPGICLIYSNVVSGVPPMFAHFVTNFPAIHQTVMFVTIQSLAIAKIPRNERFLFGRLGPSELRIFRCVVRYGYRDARRDTFSFESHLMESLTEFLKRNSDGCRDDQVFYSGGRVIEKASPKSLLDAVSLQTANGVEAEQVLPRRRKVSFCDVGVNKAVEDLEEAREAGLAYMMGNTCVVAIETSSFVKKFIIDIVYAFLRRNCRSPATSLGVPHTSLIEVGMVYHV